MVVDNKTPSLSADITLPAWRYDDLNFSASPQYVLPCEFIARKKTSSHNIRSEMIRMHL
jgi:hypothetical protein